MEEAQSPRIIDLKGRRSLLEKDEKRLQWMLESRFASPKFKQKAEADLAAVRADLEKVRAELE